MIPQRPAVLFKILVALFRIRASAEEGQAKIFDFGR
jgi:hypothetical protein